MMFSLFRQKIENDDKGRLIARKFLNYSFVKVEFAPEYMKRTYFGGIVTLKRTFEPQKTVVTRVLGIPIIKAVTDEHDMERFYINIPPFYKRSKDFDAPKKLKLKKLFKHIDKKYDDIYILHAQVGETYLILSNIEKFINNAGSKKPLFIATRRHHLELIKTFLPDIDYIFAPEFNVCCLISDDVPHEKYQRVFTFCEYAYYLRVDSNIRQNVIDKTHFVDHIIEKLEITRDEFIIKTAEISPITESRINKLIKRYNLNLDKLIFISNETSSTRTDESKQFWEDLVQDLRRQGYSIFLNITNKKNYIRGTRAFPLTFEETVYLAKKSKAIIIERSGLADVLVQANIPMHVLYNPIKDRFSCAEMPSDKVLIGYSIKKIPGVNVDNIYEYDFTAYENNEVLKDNILNEINKNVGKDIAKVS